MVAAEEKRIADRKAAEASKVQAQEAKAQPQAEKA